MSICLPCLRVLCKGKRKSVIQDRNTRSRRVVWYSHEGTVPPVLYLHAVHLSVKMKRKKLKSNECHTDTCSLTHIYKCTSQPITSRPLGFSSHSSASPCRQRGSWTAPALQNPGKLFKTGCLAEASFPSNKQSAEPDFLEAGWKYSSHIISTSRILEHLGPWGVWAGSGAAVETWGPVPGNGNKGEGEKKIKGGKEPERERYWGEGIWGGRAKGWPLHCPPHCGSFFTGIVTPLQWQGSVCMWWTVLSFCNMDWHGFLGKRVEKDSSNWNRPNAELFRLLKLRNSLFVVLL